MRGEQFWELIDRSRAGTDNCEAQAERLTALLEELDPAEIIDFDRHFTERRIQAYRWDVWAVAYIIGGGCSDDGFEYFRCWLIGQGRDFYDAVLAKPERIAERVDDEEGDLPECENLLYVAGYAYENRTGGDLPDRNLPHPAEPAGEPWTEEELEDLYPELCQRFWNEDG